MGKILPGPWVEQRKEQISFLALLEDSYRDLHFFSTETRQTLQQVIIPFKTDSNICPIHCRKALNVLDRLDEGLNSVCQKLCQCVSLAILLSPYRYSLLIDLSCIQEDTSRLMDQLDDYRLSCLKPSRSLSQQRREIINSFDKVVRQLEGVPNLITSLEKDIEVQVQRLSTIIEQDMPAISVSDPYSFKMSVVPKE